MSQITMLLPIIISTGIVSLISLIGILFMFKGKEPKYSLKSLISIAAGALLAVAFLDLLPEAIEEAQESFEPHTISAAILISILFFFILERVIHYHHCGDDHVGHGQEKHGIVVLNLLGDALHNVIDGFLIAGSFLLNFETGVLVTIAVILHEIPQEIFDFGILLYGGLNKAKAILANLAVSLTAIAGAVIFFFFGSSFEQFIPIMAAIAVGNFIYLAVADIIPELHHEKDQNKIVQHTLLLLAGVVIIYLANTLIPHFH